MTPTVREDAVLEVPITQVRPDPEQPRLKADDELTGSVREHGVLQPIMVRPDPQGTNNFVVVDGERRWRAAAAAKLPTVPIQVRTDLDDVGARVVVQLATATGKPLTPIEHARAYQRLLAADKTLNQAELAKRLGLPRSTVGDRIRLLELHPAWLKLIETQVLQVSHAPVIYQYRAVPAAYQEKAAAKIAGGENWKTSRYVENKEPIPIDQFRPGLHQAFRDYIVRLDRVRSYKGPVLEVEDNYSPDKVKWAADIEQWRPIVREQEKRQRKAMKKGGGAQSGSSAEPARKASRIDGVVRSLKSLGIELPVRNTKVFNPPAQKGETIIYTEHHGWAEDIDPETLLAKLKPESLGLFTSLGDSTITTTDAKAVEAARAAYQTRAQKLAAPHLAKVRTALSSATLEKYAVKGPGVSALLGVIRDDELKTIALALGIDLSQDGEGWVSLGDQKSAERLLSAVAAAAAKDVKLPNSWTIKRRIEEKLVKVPFKLPGPAKGKGAKKGR